MWVTASCIATWVIYVASVAWVRKSKLHIIWIDFEVRTTSCSSIKQQNSSWPTWWNLSFLSNPSSLNLIQSSFLPLVAVEITTPIYHFPFGGHNASTASPILNWRPKLNVYNQPSIICFLLATIVICTVGPGPLVKGEKIVCSHSPTHPIISHPGPTVVICRLHTSILEKKKSTHT